MTLTAVTVRRRPGRHPHMGSPANAIDTDAQPNPARHYDVSRDGQRFLVLKESAADPNATPASMVVVEHWFGEVARALNRLGCRLRRPSRRMTRAPCLVPAASLVPWGAPNVNRP